MSVDIWKDHEHTDVKNINVKLCGCKEEIYTLSSCSCKERSHETFNDQMVHYIKKLCN